MKLAGEACRATIPILQARKAILTQSSHDLKSEADTCCDAAIRTVLRESPWRVLSEESMESAIPIKLERETYWLVDPLDGTVNYHLGNPLYATSIALIEKGEPILGAVYDHGRSELCLGGEGLGATCNSESLVVQDDVVSVKGAVLGTGFPSGRSYASEEVKRFADRVSDFKKVRLLGSAALSLVWVAKGWLNAYEEKDIYLWDVAAGLAIVRAAGGVIKYSSSGNIDWQVTARAAVTRELLLDMS
ncbi:MAG: inositol monophosphatase [Verrucomicrobiota bacterium]